MTVNRVLCVDDEPQVLTGLERALRKLCPVVTCVGGAAALELLRSDRDFAVIVSDMRMPEMDGARFLSEARLLAPDAVRILLTGEADLDAVIAAVNSGHIHQYLRKPVEREDLQRIIERGFVQFSMAREARERGRVLLRGAAVFGLELIRPQQPRWVAHVERSAAIAAQLAEHLQLTAASEVEVVTMMWLLSRRTPRVAFDRSLGLLLDGSEELAGVRAALGDLQDDVTPARTSISARVVRAAILVSELESGGLGVDAMASHDVDARIFDALVALGLPRASAQGQAA